MSGRLGTADEEKIALASLQVASTKNGKGTLKLRSYHEWNSNIKWEAL